MYNKVILIGNLSRDVELRYTPSGTAIAKFGLATNRTYRDKTTNENKQEVMFIDVSVWGKAGENVNQYLKKGSKVLVEGRLTLSQWTDQNGQKRSKHEIMAESVKFLDTKKDNQQNNQGGSYQQPQQPQTQAQPQQPQNSVPEIDIDDEDIPF
jgi:single-strand DNA-binding protein